MRMSKLQKEFWLESGKHRWAIKQGATRSGKTYLDYYILAKRIRACKGQGLIVIFGNTKSTIKRNIIEPMQSIWGSKYVSGINNENECMMFGKKVYCLGADKANSMERIQGSAIEYAYGDEITTWSEGVFQMLKSRLSCPNSHFDGTCNPDNPNHWFKKGFLDGDADIFTQVYTIDDNPFLTPEFVDNLKREYRGTVYYDRYILGLWAIAEGLVFPMYANDPSKWEIKYEDVINLNITRICIGVDVGGTHSHTTFVATGIVGNFKGLIHLYDAKLVHEKGVVDVVKILEAFGKFILEVESMYPNFPIQYIFPDNAEQVILNSIRVYVRNELGREYVVADCEKYECEERIKAYVKLFNTRTLLICDRCTIVQNSYSEMIRGENEKLLDNGTTDVDTYDGAFYSFSKFLKYFIINS